MFVEHKEAGERADLDLTSVLLLDAAVKLEQRGWCQRSYGRWGNGPFCMRGAVLQAGMDRHLFYHEGISAALRRLDDAIGDFSSVWNDRPFRTKQEVIAMLRTVALSGQC